MVVIDLFDDLNEVLKLNSISFQLSRVAGGLCPQRSLREAPQSVAIGTRCVRSERCGRLTREVSVAGD